MTEQKLLTIGETALRLNVSERTIWYWIKKQNLPVVRFTDRTCRINPVCLEKWILDHKEKLIA